MKLRINTKLRAALIAAFTAVAFTLPQTYAAATVVTLGEIGTQASHDFVTDSYVLNATNSATCNLTDGSVLTMTTTTKFWGTKSDSTLTGTWTNSAALDDMNSTLGSGFVADDFSAGINYCFTAPGNQNSVALLSVDGSLYTADSSTITMYVTVAARGYTMNNFSVTGLTDATVSYATNGGDGFSSSAAFSDGAAAITMIKIEGTLNGSDIRMTSTTARNGWQTISYVINDAPAPVEDPVWNGTDQSHAWDTVTANWKDSTGETTFTSGKNAIFNSEAAYKQVGIDEAVQANKVTIDGAAYTFNIGADGSLTANKLTIAEGGSLVLGGTGVMDVSGAISLAEGAGLTVGEDNTLKVVDGLQALLSGTGVDNRGTVQVANNVTIGDSLTSKMCGTLTVADGKKLTLGTTKDSHSIDLTSLEALVLGQGANIDTKALKVDINNLTANGSTLKMLDTKAKDTDGVVLHGTTTLEGDLTITGDWKYKINIEKLAGTGSLELTGGQEEHRAVIGDVDIDSLTVTNKMNNVDLTGTVALSGVLGVNGTTNVTGQNAMTIGGLTGSAALNVANGITFNVAEGGNYSYTGTLTVGGQITKTGTGTQTIGGYAMHRAIAAREGELVLSGDFAIDAITDGDIDSGFVDASGAVADNGFAYKSGNMIVYVEDGGTVNTEGATFTLGGDEVTVAEDGKYALEYTVDKTTLWVNEGTESFAAYKEDAGDTLTKVGLAAGTTINMDSDGASIALAMQGSATVNATAAATISSISGWEGHTLNIDGTSEVTLANLTTLTGSSALEVKGGTLNTKKFVLNSADSSLKVNDGTTMNVTGDLTPTHGSVEVAGEVNISGSLDLSNGGQADVQLKIDSTGAVTAGSMWMAQAARVALEENGTFNIGNLQIVGKEGGSITTSTNNVLYGTTNTNFTINSATLSANGNVTIGNTLVDCDVLVDDGHTVTLNAAAGSVTVRDGGTINMGASGSATDLMVEDSGIVGSGVETSQAKIADGATATFAEGLDDSNVYFYEDESGETKVQVTNNTGAAAAYDGIANTEMKVTAGEMIAFTDEDVVVANSLVVNSVSNLSTGALTINTIDTDALASIETYGGQVTLMNVASEPIVLNDLTITADSIVALYQGATVAPEQEASVTIAAEGVLTAGGGTLLANLEMADGSAMVLYGETVTLGSALTMGQNILLDSTTMQALDALEIGNTHWLVQAAEGSQLSYVGDAEWYGQMFSRSSLDGDYDLVGDFNIVFDEVNGFGLTKFSNAPEPTTGTLSLLALMALAARRRRH